MRNLFWTIVCLAAAANAQQPYRTPPKPILDAATARPTPSPSVDPSGRYVLLTEREAMPRIAQLARPILRIAGHRIDPNTHGSQQTGGRRYALRLMAIADGSTRAITLPPTANVGGVAWAADGSKFAFTNTVSDGIELWVCTVDTAQAKRIDGLRLNTTMRYGAVRWMPDGKQLLCKLWTGSEAPVSPSVPTGPTVQESDGKRAPVRTYQDLLQNAHDADLFEFHMTSQLALVNPDDGTQHRIGRAAVISSAAPSPDGKHILVTRILRPYSLLVTSYSFPRSVEVWDRDGNPQRTIAKLPLADKVPIGGVLTGPRMISWIPTAAATLVWAEALDQGNPKNKVPRRDRVLRLDLSASIGGSRDEWFKTEYRYRGLQFDEHREFAFASSYDRDRRWVRIWKVPTDGSKQPPVIWHERMQRDAYANPGSPMTRRNAAGFSLMRRDGNAIFLTGRGASQQGDRPFLDRVNVETGTKQRLFRCGAGEYASVIAMLDTAGKRLLVSRESKTTAPNLWVVEGDRQRQLTHFEDTQAAFTRGIEKHLINYQRQDGVPLSGTLYTPANWDGSTRLPCVVWAYPREFVSPQTAGQVRGSEHRYTRLSGGSPLMFLLAGYAVLDGATMPIIGPKESANDNFVQQLVESARAAVAAAASAGVADPQRCAIAGHSYGAFMTANLLAHSDIFRAGIARSGAYNRTLTPFGFQNERRTYWEAPEIYFNMSPFMHAQKINEPLLMVHGAMDNNSGTFPIQSKRLFHAIKGNGGHARLVFLPFESHGYRARESVLHMLAESVSWLDRHVKNAGSTIAPAGYERK